MKGDVVASEAAPVETKPNQEAQQASDQPVISQPQQQQPNVTQLQLQQQFNLQQQQQPVVMQQLQMQAIDPQMQGQAQMMVQQIPQAGVSMPMVSNMSSVLPSQQQVMDRHVISLISIKC